MLTITRSVYGAQLQANLYLGKPHLPPANSTINELFNIHNQTNLTSGDPAPSLGYFCIGNGGHRWQTTGGGIGKTSPIPHRAYDAGLYNYLPFVMRPLNNDLNPTERLAYAMRVPKVFSGVTYWCYYLKKFDKTNISSQLKLITVTNGVKTVTAFVPDNSNLTPQPPQIPNNGAITTDGTYLAVTSTLDLSLTPTDATELSNVATIIYNDPDLAIISEIGLVTAVPKSVSLLNSSGQPATGNYTEALRAQIASFTNTYHQMSYGNQGIDLYLDLGATEPLFGPTVTSVQGG
jgi:hypothetical protein